MNREYSASTSKRSITQRKRFVIRCFGIALVTTMVIGGGLIGLSYARWGHVTDIIILDNPHVDAHKAEKDIQKAIERHWLVIANKDRHWTLPRKEIESIMKVQSNTIRSVDIKYRDHSLVIATDIFTPAFITCFSDTSCGFTSHDGYVYDLSPEFSPGVYPVLEIAQKSPVYDKGPYYLSELQRTVVDTILLKEDGFLKTPRRVVVDMLDMYIYSNTLDGVALPEESFIVMSQKHLFDYNVYITQRLKALQSKTDFFERLHRNDELFEYLDLRFDEKIYMKFNKRI